MWNAVHAKVSFFVQCSKMQLITLKNFIIKTCFIQFLWFFSLKCWFKGQIISRIHLSLPNAYKLMCFDRNINENRDVKILECDYLSVQRCVKFTLGMPSVCMWGLLKFNFSYSCSIELKAFSVLLLLRIGI